MSYFKISYESDSIEGLKTIQEKLAGQVVKSSDFTTAETQLPPPDSQEDLESEIQLSSTVEAPPLEDEYSESLTSNGEDDFFQPPPEPLAINNDLEEEIPPPPNEDVVSSKSKTAASAKKPAAKNLK